MTRWTLADTLTALVEGVTPEHADLAVESAEIALPLLVTMEHGPSGPVFRAQPPYSAFRSGVEPVAHRARLSIEQTALQKTPQNTLQMAVPVKPAAPDPSV